MLLNKKTNKVIDNSIDKKTISVLKERFHQLNRERFARTRSALTERQQYILDLIPLLFHANHPILPGYVSQKTPCGISGYEPSENELRLAQALARSINVSRHKGDREISALFVMGSVGTVAQSDSSDLDIWVCHQSTLDVNALNELEKKCLQITEWSEKFNLEVHFFLMDNNKFKRGEIAALDSEASGSAQHFLLLDEFYRTAIWLAGCDPLWWYIPSSSEKDYNNYSDTLLEKRFMRKVDTIDFGGLPTIPDGEFIGAGIWQLYKAIESPYKSVMKLMLLECYASEHPNITTLSLEFKQQIYEDITSIDKLDPYILIYKRLERYLFSRGEFKRLELLRHCFYFKINIPLTQALGGRKKSWQRGLLESLVGEWSWTKEHIDYLDSRPDWKTPQVIEEHKALVTELTNSYRFLMDFARQTQAQASINVKEFKTLGRKLYAAFERKSGKIDWVNPGISTNLNEPHITLVYSTRNDSSSLWTAYAQPAHETELVRTQVLKKARHFIELLLWSHCNNILTSDTHVELISKDTSLSGIQLKQVTSAISAWLPIPIEQTEHDTYNKPASIRRLLLLINVDKEPHYKLHQEGKYRVSEKPDPVNYGELKENLAQVVDVASLNSWGEVNTQHFTKDALLNAILYYLRQISPQDNRSLPSISVHCYSTGRGSAIQQRAEEIFRDIASCFFSGTRPLNSRYILEIAGEYCVLQYIDAQIKVAKFISEPFLIQYLGDPQAEYSAIVVDSKSLLGSPLKTILEAPASSAIQAYLKINKNSPDKDSADIYILDERNSLLHTQLPYYDQQTLLRPLHRFIRATIQRQSLESPEFMDGFGVYPVEFYEIISPKPYKDQAVDFSLERRTATSDLKQLSFFNVKVIAEPDAFDELRYNIFCDEHEFTEMEYADELFEAVARYILSRRDNAERYPCYITDLDLSQCNNNLEAIGTLQTSHYLKIKAQLEQQLYAALLRI